MSGTRYPSPSRLTTRIESAAPAASGDSPSPVAPRRAGLFPQRSGIRRRLAAGLLGVLVGVSACADAGADRAPLSPAASAPALSTTIGSLDGWSASSENALKPLLEREKERIKLEQERSKRDYDFAKSAWELFVKQNHAKNDSPFLMCDPLQYAADTKVIGPAGGDLSIGAHKISIPRGALTQPTVITGEMPVSTVASVKLSPHGLQFAVPPVLQISYKHCYRPSGFLPTVVYFDDAQNLLEWPVTTTKDGLANARIWHFSKYGVATGRSAF